MIKKKILLFLFLIGSIFLYACSLKTSTEISGAKAAAQDSFHSPKGAAEHVMNSLKALDLYTFNEYTDNYISTTRNWIGIPTAREYRVFNELLQPALIKGKHYNRNYQLFQKITQNLSWEITDVSESDNQAEITMNITNIDMSLATGNYIVFLLENMSQSGGIGLGSLVKDMSDLNRDMNGFLSIIDSLDPDDTCTISVTLSAFRQDGKWKLHVSDEFINAFMGNIDSEEYPEEITRKIESLEREMEENADRWAEEFGERMEGLFD